MTGANLLFEYFKKAGIKRIFGIPGDELAIFDALAHSGIEFVTTRHEQGAAFMAEAEGKMSNLPGVCISTLGPGAANLVTGVADAFQNRSPMIVLSGQLETHYHHSRSIAHQYIDLEKLYAPITKATLKVSEVGNIAEILTKAFVIALSFRRGPVHITLPQDIMEQETKRKVSKVQKSLIKQKSFAIGTIKKISKIIEKSKFPIAFFGQQCQFLDPGFKNLVLRSEIPVFSSFLGKGSFPEDSHLSLGTISRHVKDELLDVITESDLLLIFNYDYIEGINPEIFKNKTIVNIDVVSSEIDDLFHPEVEAVGDINQISKALVKSLKDNFRTQWDLDYIKDIKEKRVQHLLQIQDLESFPFNPFKIMQVLQEVLGPREIIVSDVGNHKQAIGLGLRVYQPLSIHFSNGLSTMGFSVPFAAGLRYSFPKDVRIISICGDGGFLMNVQEIETITRYNLDIKIIVFVDNAFGMIKSNLLSKYQRVKNLDFDNPDFEFLAKSFGINFMSVNQLTKLKKTLADLINSEGTTLLTLPVKYS